MATPSQLQGKPILISLAAADNSRACTQDLCHCYCELKGPTVTNQLSLERNDSPCVTTFRDIYLRGSVIHTVGIKSYSKLLVLCLLDPWRHLFVEIFMLRLKDLMNVRGFRDVLSLCQRHQQHSPLCRWVLSSYVKYNNWRYKIAGGSTRSAASVAFMVSLTPRNSSLYGHLTCTADYTRISSSIEKPRLRRVRYSPDEACVGKQNHRAGSTTQ